MNSHRKKPSARTTDDWAFLTKGLLKAELAKRDVSYPQLANLLAQLGIHDSPENLANKINRGRFSALFLVQCLEALDCRLLRLTDE